MCNKKEIYVSSLVLIFLVMSMGICGGLMYAEDTSTDMQQHSRTVRTTNPLLAELALSSRFNMGYPMDTISCGHEYTFQNAAWQTFLSMYGTGWRIMWDRRAGRPNLIEGKGIPFYAGKGNVLVKDYSVLTIDYLHGKILTFSQLHAGLLKLDFANLKLNSMGSHIFDEGRYCVIQYDYFIDGVRVEGARIYFRFNNGNLIQFGSMGIRNVKILAQPKFPESWAQNNVVEAFSSEQSDVS